MVAVNMLVNIVMPIKEGLIMKQECLLTKEKIVEKIQSSLNFKLSTTEHDFIKNNIHFKVSFNLNSEVELDFFLFKRNDTLNRNEFSKYYIKYNIISNRFSIDKDITKEGFFEENYAILAFYNIILSIDILNIIQTSEDNLSRNHLFIENYSFGYTTVVDTFDTFI